MGAFYSAVPDFIFLLLLFKYFMGIEVGQPVPFCFCVCFSGRMI